MIAEGVITAFAHGMFLRLEALGVLKAEYDGGGFSPRTEVTIYDEDGRFHFDESLDVHRALADDGMVHRAEYIKGVEQKLPVVIAVFAGIAGIFAVYNKG